MTSLNWIDATIHDMLPGMTLERQMKAICAFGGIHDFTFSTEMDDDCSGLIGDIWNKTQAAGTWSYTGGDQLVGGGAGGANWHHIQSLNDMPESGSLTFMKYDARGAVLIRAVDHDTHYRLYWDATHVGLDYVKDGSDAELIKLPKVYAGTSEVEVVWREVQYTSEDFYRWLFISIYFDGELALTHGDNIASSGLRTLGQKVGLAVYSNDIINFDDIRVPEFSEIGDWASLDENEAPGGALHRLIGQRHVRMFARYDGTLKVWKPAAVASSQVIDTSRIKRQSRTIDRRKLVSHTRVQGAYVSADSVDTGLIKQVGHRYRRIDMPHLMTEEECAAEGAFFLDRAEEESDTIHLELNPYVILEPEDRISLPDGEYLIAQINLTGNAAKLDARYGVRKYVV